MGGAHVDDVERVAISRIGRVLRGELRLDSVLGVGGTAAVYASTHQRTGKRCAVKILHPQLGFDARIRERFFREGYVVNRIEHAGVVRVVDDGVDDDGAIFLVMNLLEGATVEALAGRRGGGRLPLGDVLFIADQVLDVLAAAHALGIVHRDLKPENLFCTRDGSIKVLDFGIARLVELGRTFATRTGIVMGTPAFMPPEQARGRWAEVDARTDIWALGASMFALLTGRLVHEAPTTNEMLLAAMKARAPELRRVMPEASDALAALVDRALLYDKNARWPDARSMQEAIRRVMVLHPSPSFGDPPDAEPTERDAAKPAAIVSRDASVNPFYVTDPAPSPPSPRILSQRTLKDSSPPGAMETRELGEEVDAFVQRGSARGEGGDLEGAAEDFERALELDPGCVAAFFNRGVVRHRLGDYEGALADYGDALALRPRFGDAHHGRALALSAMGDVAGAREAARAAASHYEAAGREVAAAQARELDRSLDRSG